MKAPASQVSCKDFIGALTVEQHSHPGIGRQAHHAPLSVNAGACKGMFLAPSQLVHFLNHAAWIRINRVVVDWETLRYRLDEPAFIVDGISEASRESALPIRIL